MFISAVAGKSVFAAVARPGAPSPDANKVIDLMRVAWPTKVRLHCVGYSTNPRILHRIGSNRNNNNNKKTVRDVVKLYSDAL